RCLSFCRPRESGDPVNVEPSKGTAVLNIQFAFTGFWRPFPPGVRPGSLGRNDSSAELRRRAEILREERECAAPGKVRRGLVVARAAGVVVERVLRALIDMLAVLLVVGLERGLEVGDALVDVVVVLGVLQKQRRLDRRDLVGGRLRAVVGNAGIEVRAV